MYCCPELIDPVDTAHFPPAHVAVNTGLYRYVLGGKYIGFGKK